MAPSSERWRLCWNPSCVRLICVWLSAYPSCVRWCLCWLCIASVRGCIRLREELCTPGCSCPKSSVEVPCVGVLCGQVSGLKILLCEGGDVELGARTSKQISLFAFDPLTLNSLSLSFILCLASFHIAHSYIICLACLCVPHLCLTMRASYSTSTLIQRNQEELVQSPSPGIRLHSLVTLSVLHF